MKTSESTTAARNRFYEFGAFRLDAAKRLLRRDDGTPVALTARVFDTLLFMVEHADTVLDKERLMEAVWPDSIVEENNLTQNISTLRRVFGERPGTHQFIVTVPGRGYRFVAPVRAVDPAVAENAPDEPATAEPKRESSAIDEKDSVDSNLEALNAPGRTRFRPAVIALAAASLLIAVATVLWLQRASRSDTHSSGVPAADKSIAVLPFANLSDDKQNSYFAAAVQDEILTDLAKIADLKVISRMSANAYPVDQPRNAREIGRQLGVAHLLEGSVQRVGERIRVHAQLIDARADSHVWAQSYDRELVDVFALQREIATAIAQQLQARLTTAPPPIASAKPTENPQAYLLYLRARELELANADYLQVSDVYRQAIRLDPKFALARAVFSIYLNSVAHNREDVSLAGEAEREAKEALRLRPDLGEAHLAMAYGYLYGAHDYDRASSEVARAGQLLPNSAEVPLLTAFLCKAQNRFGERIVALRRADALDPRNIRVHTFLVLTYRWLRMWPAAIQASEERRILAGDGCAASQWSVANDEFQLTGDIGVLKKAISQDATAAVPPGMLSYERFAIAMLERDYPTAAKYLAEVPPTLLSDQTGVWTHPKAFQAVLLAVASNANSAIKADALIEGEKAVRAGDKTYASMHQAADLALIYTFAGRKEEAIREASSAIETASSTSSLIEKNDMSCALAAVYAQTAEPEKAIDLIEHLLTVPVELQHGAVYNMTLTDLKWSWIWDPLRKHPRFQKILAGPEPKTIY